MSIQRIPTLGLTAGLGVLLGLASNARAGGYGHAEITLGFPNGQVTVGRTWDSDPREVVVERVTHKYPDPDIDDEDKTVEETHQGEVEDGDADEVIIEKRVRPRHKKVVVIERYEEPEYYDQDYVVHRVYVDPPCPRRDVVVYRSPERVIYAPRRVIVGPSRCERGGYRGEIHVEGHGGGYGHGSYHNDGGGRGYDRGPRNLFPEDNGRPTGNGGLRPPRGVQRIVSR
jgi:hypothetical protein